MSKTYKTGDKLKKDILATASRFFDEYGYDKTTYQMIADELDISKAVIAYHFKIKPWIIFKIGENYRKGIYTYVKTAMDGDFNYFKLHITAQLIIYRAILKYERNKTLFFHKDHIALWETERLYLIEDYFKEIAKDFKKVINEEELHAAALMNLGAKLSIFKEFNKAPEVVDIDTQCKNMMYLVGLLSRLDEATISRNVDYAFSFADKHNLPGINLTA